MHWTVVTDAYHPFLSLSGAFVLSSERLLLADSQALEPPVTIESRTAPRSCLRSSLLCRWCVACARPAERPVERFWHDPPSRRHGVSLPRHGWRSYPPGPHGTPASSWAAPGTVAGVARPYTHRVRAGVGGLRPDPRRAHARPDRRPRSGRSSRTATFRALRERA